MGSTSMVYVPIAKDFNIEKRINFVVPLSINRLGMMLFL